MKKLIYSIFSIFLIGGIVLISCKSKNSSDAITPTYKELANNGSGTNPNKNNVTTTGASAPVTIQANSSLTGIGTVGVWSSINCNLPLCLNTTNTNLGTSVSLCFISTPVAGTYTLVPSSSQLTSGTAIMTITNPPGQDAGSIWFSEGGTIKVSTTSGIKATFDKIYCKKTTSTFYYVSASGEVGCL